VKKIITIALLLFGINAFAQVGVQPAQLIPQPLKYTYQVCGLPASIAYTEFNYAQAGFTADVCLIAPANQPGWQMNGFAASARINTNASAYSKAVAGYFSAEVFGFNTGFAEAVGIYARVEPAVASTWGVALHGECRARTTLPGLCMGLNIELRGDPNRTPNMPDQQTYIGMNIQPGADQTGVIGLQFQHPQAYAHSIDLDGTCVKLGAVDGVGFYMRFGGRSQLLEFWRGGCAVPGATRHGFVNMNWGTPDTQLNR
jgi:hypothetical protein